MSASLTKTRQTNPTPPQVTGPILSYFIQSVYETDVSKRSITQAYCESRRDRDSGRKHVTGVGACCTLD